MQYYKLSTLEVSFHSLVLFPNTKLPKATDENIISPFQGLPHQFEKGLNDLGRFSFREKVFCKQVFHDMSFCQRSLGDTPLPYCSFCASTLALRAIDLSVTFALAARAGKQ